MERVAPLLRRQSGEYALFFLPLILFLALSLYQLNLPGLHYDEAKEAGLNAMQLVRAVPLAPFRGAGLHLLGRSLPWMVQDYIGALNVYLAVPLVAALGPTTLALRLLPLIVAVATLFCLYRLALAGTGSRWLATVAALLLAVNPSFIFWSRQGIFVTNLTALFFIASLLALLRWWRTGSPNVLYALALLWALGLWAKLLFIWAIGATVVGVVLASIFTRSRPTFSWRQAVVASLIFVLGLTPLILFNVETGGTLLSIFGNLGTSYYGVQNAAFSDNLMARLDQIPTLLRGDHFWYLGELHANPAAVYAASALLLLALGVVAWRRGRNAGFLLPLLLIVLIVAQSSFTVSGLFITHFSLLLPLIPLTAVFALTILRRTGRPLLLAVGLLLIAAWGGGDLRASLLTHQALASSGGYFDQSDAIYPLADYLESRNITAPLVLDWGFSGQIEYLTGGRVHPIEVFGYERTDAPDAAFAHRVAPFLENPQNAYILHTPEATQPCAANQH